MKKPARKTPQRRLSPRSHKRTRYVLRLYITGATPRSSRAIANINKICQEHLKGQFELEVIDLYKDPALGKGEQIIASPTLIKKLPLPLRRFIGDLSDTERIIVGLDLQAESHAGQRTKNVRRS
jgi:circadian clock protein KaiB